MADKKDDISKDAASNLQKAAQALATVSEKMEKVFSKGADFAKAMTKEVKETAKEAKTAEEYFDGIKSLTADLSTELGKNAEQQKIQNNALATGNSIAIATLTLEKDRAVELARSQGMAAKLVAEMEDQYNAAIQMTTEYERQVAEQEAAEKLAEENLAHTEALKDKLKEITGYQGVFKDIFTDGRLAAGVFLNQVNKGMKNMTGLFDHARKEGMTVSQGLHETGVALSDSFSLTGTSAKDSMEVMSGMREEMGNLEGITRKTRLEAASLARSYGISNEEAGKLTAQLGTMPGATMDTANETARFAANMAKSAGVAPGAVLKDMSKNSENVAKFGKDGGKNMAMMAVAAKKVGVEMSSMAAAAEGLLDFENSIEKQMEASVLLGREINLDKAREKALNGDLVGATKEMLANVGGEAEFNKMNVVQRKALADSMGVSVSELGKMVKNQDKLNDLSEDQQAALAAGEVTMDELAAGAGGLFDKLKNVAVTGFSLVKGFNTMATGVKNAVDFGKQLGIQSMQELKALMKKIGLRIQLGVMAVKDFVVQKANAIWMASKDKQGWLFKSAMWIKKKAFDAFTFAKSKAHAMFMAAKEKQSWLFKAGMWAKEKAFLLWKMAKESAVGKQAASLAGKAQSFVKDKAKGLMGGAKDKVVDKTKDAVTGGAKKGADALKSGGDSVEKTQKSASKMGAGGGAGKSLKKLADGVGAFGKGKVILGALVGLPATALGMVTMVAAIPALAFLALAGIPAATGLKALAKGVEAMGKGKVMMGAVVVGVLSLSMIALGAAAMLFAQGGAAGTMLMVVAMYALVGALALMGGLGLSGVGFIGVALVLAMGAALMLMGLGVKFAAEGMAVLVEAFIGLFGAITLESLVPIFMLGPALAMAAVGIVAFSASLFVLAIAALFGAPALVVLGGAMFLLGMGVALAAAGLVGISEVLPTLSDGFTQIAATVPGLFALGGALLAMIPALFGFAFASFFAVGPILALGIALTVVAASLLIAEAAMAGIAVLAESLSSSFSGVAESIGIIVALLPGMLMMGTALFGMAAGLVAFATAGILTLPTIMGLMALSLVAPILIALGQSINYSLGGDGGAQTSPEDDKMDQLIEEVRGLKAAFQTPGVINMDGQKVGDVIGLAVSTSGVA